MPATLKVWIANTDEKVCAQCDALDGERRAIGENFSGDISGPPAHPNCRCRVEHTVASQGEPTRA